MGRVLLAVKNQLAMATDSDNYKIKTAESNEAELKQAYDFLKENNLQGTLSRRLVKFDEVQSIIWRPTEEAEEEVKAAAGSALDAAFGALSEEKDPRKAAHAKFDEMLDKQEVTVRMSLQSFVEQFEEIATLSLSREITMAQVLFVSGPAEEGDHDKLLSYDLQIGKHFSLLAATKPYPFSMVYALAGLGAEEFKQRAETEDFRVAPKDIKIDGVFRSRRFEQGEYNYAMQVNGLGSNFYHMLRQHGTAVLGSAIRSEHFGMSRAIVELSKKMTMDVSAGEEAAGGIWLAPGQCFHVVKKDGTRHFVVLTSLK
jgi:hypothetical protein